MRRLYFQLMAALLMLSLASGMPRVEAPRVAMLSLPGIPGTAEAEESPMPQWGTRLPERILSRVASERGRYYGSHPAPDVYVTQTIRHTCTLVAATMMIRNYASLRGSPYLHMTSGVVSRYCWSKRYGLAQSFSVGQVEVACSPEIRTCADKKRYLIDALRRYREGVVIYDTGAPHAIWLIGYDESTDTFWCADTIRSRGGHAIPLKDSIIKGASQQDKVNTIDKIWYIKDRNYRV